MSTQLLLLVGTNPLPIWVAWQYLHKQLAQPVEVRFVYTENTQNEVERLRAKFSGAVIRPGIKTSPGNPAVVRDNIRVAVDPLPPDLSHVHVHYTGGTKVMAVETVTGLERYRAQVRGTFQVDTSYLDPRGDTGPILINHQGHKLVQDTRQTIQPDLRQIAQLNGFVTGEFTHLYYRGNASIRKTYPAPAKPSEQERQAGREVLSNVRDRNKWSSIFTDRESRWRQTFRQDEEENLIYPEQAGTFSLPEPPQPWQQSLLSKLKAVYPHCPWDVVQGTLSYPARNTASQQGKEDLNRYASILPRHLAGMRCV